MKSSLGYNTMDIPTYKYNQISGSSRIPTLHPTISGPGPDSPTKTKLLLEREISLNSYKPYPAIRALDCPMDAFYEIT